MWHDEIRKLADPLSHSLWRSLQQEMGLLWRSSTEPGRQTHSSDHGREQVVAAWRSGHRDLSFPFPGRLYPFWKAQTWLLSLFLNLFIISGLSCFCTYPAKNGRAIWYCNMPDPLLLCSALNQCLRCNQGQILGLHESWNRWALTLCWGHEDNLLKHVWKVLCFPGCDFRLCIGKGPNLGSWSLWHIQGHLSEILSHKTLIPQVRHNRNEGKAKKGTPLSFIPS